MTVVPDKGHQLRLKVQRIVLSLITSTSAQRLTNQRPVGGRSLMEVRLNEELCVILYGQALACHVVNIT